MDKICFHCHWIVRSKYYGIIKKDMDYDCILSSKKVKRDETCGHWVYCLSDIAINYRKMMKKLKEVQKNATANH